jgi:hypothetical protein
LRQDHPAVGIVCPTSFDTSTFNGESKYIHLLRAIAILEKYLQAPPENPDENWGRWKSHATEARNYLKSDAMSNQKVIMICEVQVLLSQYLKARKQMHLLYKEVRADSEKHLAKQFAVAAVDGRPENATWVTEEKRYVEKSRGRVKDGQELALLHACNDGFVAAVRVALEVDGVNVNQKSRSGQTPLWIASMKGHVEVTKLILTVDGVDVNQAENTGATGTRPGTRRNT